MSRVTPRGQVVGWFVACSVVVYVCALPKFVLRDPLGADVGFQGLYELACIGLAFVLACAAALAAGRPIRPPRAAAFLIAYGVLALYSSPNSFYPLLSVAKAVMFIAVVILAVLVASLVGARVALRSFYFAMLGVLVVGIVTGLALSGTYPLFSTSEGIRNRFSIFATHPGILADYLVFTFLLGRLLKPGPPAYLQALLVGALVLTQARTAIGGLAAVVLITAVIGVSGKARYMRLVLAIAVAATVALFWLSPASQPTLAALDDLTAGYFSRTQGDLLTLNGRVPLWQALSDLLSNTWIVGYGFDGSRAATLNIRGWAGDSHNGYLEVILISGIPGAAALLVGWLMLLKSGAGLKTDRERGAFYAPSLYLAITSLVGGPFTEGTGLAGFLLAMLACLALQEAVPGSVGLPLVRADYPERYRAKQGSSEGIRRRIGQLNIDQ
jgi:O-antigen ligase